MRRSTGTLRAGPGRLSPPPVVVRVLGSAGPPLEAATRGLMEERFGHDFGMVRIHTDAEAAQSARAIHARAYTYGRHVVMGPGRYQPDTPAGGAARSRADTRRPAGQSGDRARRPPAPSASRGTRPSWRRIGRRHGARAGRRPDHGGAASAGLVQRQDDDDWPAVAARSAAAVRRRRASGSWGPDDDIDNVTMVELSCSSTSDGTIDFHLRSGSVASYRLTLCDITPGDYVAEVEVTGDDIALHFDLPGNLLFRFAYAIGPGQQDPSTFFGGQRRVAVRAGPTTAGTAGPVLPLVCSRPLDFPAWTGLQNFRHAYINDPPANYAIRGLVSGNGVTASCSTATDASGTAGRTRNLALPAVRRRRGRPWMTCPSCLRAHTPRTQPEHLPKPAGPERWLPARTQQQQLRGGDDPMLLRLQPGRTGAAARLEPLAGETVPDLAHDHPARLGGASARFWDD